MESGTMFTRDWDSLDFVAELPESAPYWLFSKVMEEEEEEGVNKI